MKTDNALRKDYDAVKGEILFQITHAKAEAKKAVYNLESKWDQIKVLVSVSWKTWAQFAGVALVFFILGALAF